MNSLQIAIEDHATPALAALADDLKHTDVRAAAGGAVARLLQDHLGDLDSSRANKLGGQRTHFYADAARAVEYDARDDGVDVSIHKTGIALRFFGGTIAPVNAKYLTIPAIAEAYGSRAGEFNNLEVAWGRRGPIGLRERPSQDISIAKDRRKGREGQTRLKRGAEHAVAQPGRIFFWLVKSATMEPDPTVLPDEDTIGKTAVAAITAYLLARRRGR